MRKAIWGIQTLMLDSTVQLVKGHHGIHLYSVPSWASDCYVRLNCDTHVNNTQVHKAHAQKIMRLKIQTSCGSRQTICSSSAVLLHHSIFTSPRHSEHASNINSHVIDTSPTFSHFVRQCLSVVCRCNYEWAFLRDVKSSLSFPCSSES